MKTTHIDYWANLKAVLIFMVVLGHFLLPIAGKGGIVQAVYFGIYMFHMPAFAFVSGVFSKSYVKKDNKAYRLVGFLSLYYLFTAAVIVINFAFHQHYSAGALLNLFMFPSGAPWYMLASFFWYLIIPFVSQLRFRISFPLSVILALAVGKYPECGDFLALSRTIVFFPFFLVGYHYSQDCHLSKSPAARICGICFLFLSAVTLFFFRSGLSDLLKVIYASSSYGNLGFKKGVLMRTLWYFWASCMTVSLMCIIPRSRLFFTYVGDRTLCIYILHVLIRNMFRSFGGYNYLSQYIHSDLGILFVFALLSITIVFLVAIEPLSEFFKRFFHLTFFVTARADT